MEEKKMTKSVELPDFTAIQGDKLGATLCNLFTYLIPEDMARPVDVDPRKIRLNHRDCKKLITSIQKTIDKNKALKVSLLWLNQGPAGDEDIPEGKIYLEHGYMRPANEKGGQSC